MVSFSKKNSKNLWPTLEGNLRHKRLKGYIPTSTVDGRGW